MANEAYLEGGYTPPQTQETEGGSFEDYAVTSNIFGMSMYNPETNMQADTLKDRWNSDEKKAVFDTLQTPEEYSLLNSSLSKEHYEIQKNRRDISKEAEARIANDNGAFQFLAGSAMAMADPTVLIPGTLAFKGAKGLVALQRIAYGAATGATMNAAQEGILATTNARENQAGSAAFWGATIGGGMFAIGPMIAGGSSLVSKRAAKAYTEPSIVEKQVSGDLENVQYEPGNDYYTYVNEEGVTVRESIAGVGLEPMQLWPEGEAPAMNNFIQKFVISPVSRLAKSKYPLFNRLGSMLQSSPISRKMGGKVFTEGTNAWDVKQLLGNFKAQALKEQVQGHKRAQEMGYTGNADEYAKEVSDAIDDLIYENTQLAHSTIQAEMSFAERVRDSELEKAVVQQQSILNNQVKNRILTNDNLITREQDILTLKEAHDAEVARVQEEYLAKWEESQPSLRNSNYQARLQELLEETNTNIDLSRVPEHLHDGVKAYQKYVKEYAEKMKKLDMKGSSNFLHNLYKTRSWNLDSVGAKSTEELTPIIREAFIQHPMNKALIKYGNMKEATVEKRVAEIVQHMQEVDLVRMMPDNTLTVPSEMPLGQFLEQKNFQLNDKYLGDLIDRDIRSSMETYNYNMSGRVALQTMFGTDNLSILKREVVLPAVKQAEAMGATEGEIRSLSEDFDTLFEQILGTHGLPSKPNAWGERATRTLMKLNYLTFGGGFGINALADLGVVAFTNGLGNTLRHFGPSLKALRNMDVAAKDTPWVEQAIAMGALSDFYSARSLSRFDDMDTMFTVGKAEKWLDKGGQIMQNASGLQHITAMEELMAIGGGTVDIVNTARAFKETGTLPRGFEERMARYGISTEDLKWVADQPLIIKDGKLIDFNWSKWDNPQRMQQFQTMVTKMMNDAVIRGDKTLLPNIITSANPFMRLMTQFMRYPHIAYERVLLRGASKPTARFLTGTMVSATTMASIYYIREQALIQAGVIDERDAKYALYDKYGRFDEEALTRLSMVVLMKMPQFGVVPDIAGKGMALAGQPVPGRTYEESPWTAIGGVSASRFDTFTRGLKGIVDGEFDSTDAYYMGKSVTPFQNFLQLDQVYNPMIKELIK